MRPIYVPFVIAALFALTAIGLAARLPLVDDEGYLTYLGAATLHDSPLPTFFFLKFHPTLSVLYAPVVGLGWRAFLAAHALVGAAGVALVGALAQRLGFSGVVASAVLALSPVYLLAAASGQSNSDGITLLLLSLWLATCRDRPALRVLAGVAFAATLWARYEFALAVGAVFLHLAAAPGARWMLVGLLGAPAVYLLAGATYHADLLWWIHFPPTLPTPLPGVDFDAYVPRNFDQLVAVATQLSLGSAAWLTALSGCAEAPSPFLRTVRRAALITLAAMVALPFARVLNFVHNPRYLGALLPFTALLAAAWAAAPTVDRVPFVLLAVSVPLLELAAAASPGALTGSLALALLLPLGAWLPTPRARSVLMVAAAAGSLALSATTTLFDNSRADSGELAASRWIVAHARGREVYTNDQRIALTLLATGGHPRYLVAFDIQTELVRLLDARNGQRAAVLRALSPRLYGDAAWACSFTGAPLPRGALFVLGADDRILRFFPRREWDAETEPVASFGAVVVRALRGDGRGLTPRIDPAVRITPAQLTAPCDDVRRGARPPP